MDDAQRLTRRGPNIFITILWVLFVGWWLGLAWSAVAWLFTVSIIGLPVGVLMLNRLPQVTTLRPPLERADGGAAAQRPFALRALYFLLIGWWFSALWLSVAWACAALIIGLPLAVWMWNRTPFVATLARY